MAVGEFALCQWLKPSGGFSTVGSITVSDMEGSPLGRSQDPKAGDDADLEGEEGDELG
jgi:hypothetical protein